MLSPHLPSPAAHNDVQVGFASDGQSRRKSPETGDGERFERVGGVYALQIVSECVDRTWGVRGDLEKGSLLDCSFSGSVMYPECSSILLFEMHRFFLMLEAHCTMSQGP